MTHHPTTPTHSALPTECDEETWMSKAKNLYAITLYSYARMAGFSKQPAKTTVSKVELDLDPDFFSDAYPVEGTAPNIPLDLLI